MVSYRGIYYLIYSLLMCFWITMGSMVLVYLPTKLGNFVRANVGKYSSIMEHMGLKVRFFDNYICHIIDQATERYGTGTQSYTNWIPSSKLTVCD